MTEEVLAMHGQYETQLLVAVNFSLFLNLFSLFFAVVTDPYIKKKHRWLLLLVSFLALTMVVQTQLDNYLGVHKISRMGRTLVAMYGYQVRPLILALFIQIADMEHKHRPVWIAVLINAMIFATAPFSGVAFAFGENLIFVRGPLGYSCHVISFGLLMVLLESSIRSFGKRRKLDTIIPIGISVAIVGAVLADVFFGSSQWISYLTVAIVGGCTFYYVCLHSQFSWEHEKALLAEQHMQVMIAQIQPHFLYSTLTTIQQLCKTEPEKAYRAMERFGAYLKENDAFLNHKGLISFQKELEHTMEYLEIEKLRFPNLQIEFDIRTSDFQVPALSLQPLVEDAISHGVGELEKGVLRVSSSLEGEEVEIIVWDNGMNVDEKAGTTSDLFHLGVQSVQERIESMCGGSLKTESFVGDATIVTIRIPREDRHGTGQGA